MSMGVQDSPGYQQDWAEGIKWVVNDKVLLPLCRKHLRDNGFEERVILEMDSAGIAAFYMDDACVRSAKCFTLEQAHEQFAAVLAFLTKHGIQFSEKKNVWPSEKGNYVGVALDTVLCEAFLQKERAVRYVAALDEVVSAVRLAGKVQRRLFASLLGKLQFTSDVARGLRVLLQPLYVTLMAFDTEPGQGCEWEDYVYVRVGGIGFGFGGGEEDSS